MQPLYGPYPGEDTPTAIGNAGRGILLSAAGDVKPCLQGPGISALAGGGAGSGGLAGLAAASRALGGRVQLTPERRILLLEEMRCEEPLTPMVLMSNTVRLLLEAQPFLELLTQVVEPPAAAGHANVQE